MISLKAIRNPFPSNHAIFHDQASFKRKTQTLSFCKNNDSDNNAKSDPPKPEGDTQKQELLARIAMLQTQKVRLTDYLDEKQAYLTQFAEEANAEIDQIGENALRELDEAGTRIMENIESRMQAFEESAEMNKQEIEENEKKVADFEGQIQRDRNEGMFFQNLGQKKPVDKESAKQEAEKISELAKKSAGSQTRRNIYLGLIGLVVIGIADAVVTSSDWRKVPILGVILIGLVTQLTYEQNLLSESERSEQEKIKEEKQ